MKEDDSRRFLVACYDLPRGPCLLQKHSICAPRRSKTKRGDGGGLCCIFFGFPSRYIDILECKCGDEPLVFFFSLISTLLVTPLWKWNIYSVRSSRCRDLYISHKRFQKSRNHLAIFRQEESRRAQGLPVRCNIANTVKTSPASNFVGTAYGTLFFFLFTSRGSARAGELRRSNTVSTMTYRWLFLSAIEAEVAHRPFFALSESELTAAWPEFLLSPC